MAISGTDLQGDLIDAFIKRDTARAEKIAAQLPKAPDDFTVHPSLAACVAANHGHCYLPAHQRIAELLMLPEALEWRTAVINGNVQSTLAILQEWPAMVHADFTAGRGLSKAIHYVASVRMAQIVLDHGAELECETTLGETPLMMQLRFGTLELAQFFLERGAHPRGNHMPSKDLKERIDLLLKYGWELESCFMLHDANHGHGARVRIWLEAGADANATDQQGQTALHLFAQRGKGRSAILALIKSGAELGRMDNQGKTALDCARVANSDVALKVFEGL